jgi:sulfur carrier protein
MKLRLNGDISVFKDGISVSELLESLRIEPKGVAVEVNLDIIKKQDYQDCMLKDGDSVEVVNFVGGG